MNEEKKKKERVSKQEEEVEEGEEKRKKTAQSVVCSVLCVESLFNDATHIVCWAKIYVSSIVVIVDWFYMYNRNNNNNNHGHGNGDNKNNRLMRKLWAQPYMLSLCRVWSQLNAEQVLST